VKSGIIFITLFYVFSGYSQDKTINEVVEKLHAYHEAYPVEKIYLHLDRAYYTTGETIWFKIYSTTGDTHQLSHLSNIAYVELIDTKGTLVVRHNILVENGIGTGYLTLADSLNSGYYKVRSYSKWMQNFDPDFFFEEEVAIFNIFENLKSLEETVDVGQKLDVQFFPEGGDLVYGIESVVGFKAINTKGEGTNVHGTIMDDLGTEVCSFESADLGMGKFSLSPQTGRRYYAVVDHQRETIFNLPLPKPKGYVLRIENQVEQETIAIQVLTNILEADNEFHIIIHCRGMLLFATSTDISLGEIKGAIPYKRLLSGINHITIFDKWGSPVAERIFFVDKKDLLNINAKSEKTDYTTREKVVVDIEVKDGDGNPVTAFLSLVATDDNQVVIDDNRSHILSYLLLSSDLKGNIENPGYYFNLDNDDRYQKLDLLMLTQGWRRFRWEEMIEERLPEIKHPVEKGFSISGTMKGEFNNKPLANETVNFVSTDYESLFGVVETNGTGEFIISDFHLFGEVTLAFSGEYGKRKHQVKFEFDTTKWFPSPSPPIKTLAGTIHDFERTFLRKGIERRNIDAAFNSDNQVRVLDEVIIKAKKEDSDIRYSDRKFGPPPRKNIKASELPHNYTHPLQMVQGQVAGLQVIPSSTGYRVTISGNGPSIFWNGIRLNPASLIDGFSASQVGEIDIYVTGVGAAIMFYSKLGGSGYDDNKGATFYSITGFLPVREFYSPKYDTERPEHQKADHRATLHWQPDIITDAEGKAKVEFYTTDLKSIININIEGITSSGVVGVKSMSIESK